MKRWNKPRKTGREFAFRGFLTCGKCGCSFTAQLKKKKYVYYNCTQARGKCSSKVLREDRLDAKIGEILKAFRLRPEDFEVVKTGLLQSHAGEKEYHDQAVTTLHQEYRKLQAKLDQAYNDKLEGKITAEFWERQTAAWRKEQEENRAAVAGHENANQSYFDLGVAILELAANAYENYRVRSLSEKRRLASALLSNLTVTGENVVPVYKEPFGLLAEGLSRPNWLPESDALQNGNGLLFEFSFGQLNTTKGEKRLLPAEAFKDAAGVRVERTRNWSAAERVAIARKCREHLASNPALTRKELARQLYITTARLNQLLKGL